MAASGPSRSTSRQEEDWVTIKPSWQGSTQPTCKVNTILNAMSSNNFGSSHEDISRKLACVTDYWLPITSHSTMPPALEPSQCHMFIQQQSSVLDPAFEFNGQHYNLDNNASIPEGQRLPRNIEYKKTLGQGHFGYVAQVSDKNGRAYALKVISRKTQHDDAREQMRMAKQEIEVLRRVDHVHCIKFVGSYTDAKSIGIIVNPAADCNLAKFLSHFDHRNEDQYMVLASFFGSLASALEYLHYDVRIRHKDIKPQNILVKGENVMLADFGISLDWSEKTHSTTNQEAIRSPVYCSPEVARGEPRNSRSDVWSLGCVFLEMAAVIHGQPSTYVQNILQSHGCCNFRDCPEGIEEAITTLRKTGLKDRHLPLDWVKQMLMMRKEDRWTSAVLRDEIYKSRGQSDLSFCGTCCEEHKPRSPASSPVLAPTMTGAEIVADTYGELNKAAEITEKAELYSATKGWQTVTLIRREDISINWIPAGLVDSCNLEMLVNKDQRDLNLAGLPYASSKYVELTFTVGGGPVLKRDFWVAPLTAPLHSLIWNTSTQ
ncbi:unnamed protein product [Clonostachys byssicola]|uniref:non-specific serine/threonine protein kinase n=1 Tax=Clonostachys byssicola TaxID=160290 RepID=A0A9N9Y0Z7_9HYPO|nr:unnamed protein product [Clonostachys byssicola]